MSLVPVHTSVCLPVQQDIVVAVHGQVKDSGMVGAVKPHAALLTVLTGGSASIAQHRRICGSRAAFTSRQACQVVVSEGKGGGSNTWLESLRCTFMCSLVLWGGSWCVWQVTRCPNLVRSPVHCCHGGCLATGHCVRPFESPWLPSSPPTQTVKELVHSSIRTLPRVAV